MKQKRMLSFFLAVVTVIMILPFSAQAKDDIVFSFKSELEAGEKPELGDEITFTVGITENSGFNVGTLFFDASDNLTYSSSTIFGEPTTDDNSGEADGKYGIIYLEREAYTKKSDNIGTITYTVSGLGDISVKLIPEGFRKAITEVNHSITPSAKLTATVATPEAPTVITEKLPTAVLNNEYSFNLEASMNDYVSWEIVKGALPLGLDLLNDGTVSGTPTQFGEFKFTVKASIFDTVESETKELTLTVLEKPLNIELTPSSKYEITEDGYLKKVITETKLSDVLENIAYSENIKIFDAKGAEITDADEYIGTGFKIKLYHGDTEVHSLETVVLGDVSGDGKLGASDYRFIKSYCFGKYELEGAFLEAAKITGKDSIGASDYRLLKSHCFGKYDIYN